MHTLEINKLKISNVADEKGLSEVTWLGGSIRSEVILSPDDFAILPIDSEDDCLKNGNWKHGADQLEYCHNSRESFEGFGDSPMGEAAEEAKPVKVAAGEGVQSNNDRAKGTHSFDVLETIKSGAICC
jgi:hypothetical protein